MSAEDRRLARYDAPDATVSSSMGKATSTLTNFIHPQMRRGKEVK